MKSRRAWSRVGVARLSLALGTFVSLALGSVADAAPPQSDDFDRSTLDQTVWTIVDPSGGGLVRTVGADTGDATLEMTVPSGVSHDPWHDNRSLRVMQQVDDADFEVEVIFQSEPSERYQMQGVVVEQDANDWVRFDFYHDGRRLRIFGGATVDGNSSTLFKSRIDTGDAGGLRVARVDDLWTIQHLDASGAWITAATVSHPMIVNSVGLFSANHERPETNSPEFTVVIDYFENTAAPIVDEDGGAPPDTTGPVITDLQTEVVGSDTLEVRWLTNEAATGAVAWGLTTDYELGTLSNEGGLFEHSFEIGGLEIGQTYQLGVSATDAAGNVTLAPNLSVLFDVPPPPPPPQAPVIDVWYGLNQYFGLVGQPQPYVNIVGNVSDADGVVVDLFYQLNGGETVYPLTIGPDRRRLENPGDFNADIPTAELLPGANTVEITAIDDSGSVSDVSVQVNYTPDTVWPLPYSLEWSLFSTDTEVAMETWVVDGKWTLTSESGAPMVRTVEPGYDRLLGVGDRTWTDYEFEVPMIFHTLPDRYGGGVLLRWNGHTDNPVAGRQPKEGWRPSGAILWVRRGRLQILTTDGPGNDVDLAAQSRDIATDVTYMLKGRVETIGGGGAQYSLKLWEQGDPEPSGWDLIGQDFEAQTFSGSLLLLAHLSDMSFGDLTVTELTPPVDDEPPAISNIDVVTTANSALVTWTTDEAADSRVEYGLTTAFGAEVNSGELTTSHTLVIPDLIPETTYFFRVWSTDISGNIASSTDLEFTTDAVGAPASIASDEFNSGSLDTGVWTFDNSGAPDGSLAVNADHIALSVPGGSDHEVWEDGIRVPRVVQYPDDGDFHIEVKMDSLILDRFQQQGIVVEQDADNYLRFDFYSNGNDVNAFALSMRDGSANVAFNEAVPLSPPYYMRLRRTGTTWIQSYSDDGDTWTEAGVLSGESLTMNSIGLYAGNAGRSNAPSHTALFDYLRVVEEPVRAPCPSDINADGWVDAEDLRLLLELSSSSRTQIELEATDAGRIERLLADWGPCR